MEEVNSVPAASHEVGEETIEKEVLQLETTCEKTQTDSGKDETNKQKNQASKKRRKGKTANPNMTQTTKQPEDFVDKVQKKVSGSKDSIDPRDWIQK